MPIRVALNHKTAYRYPRAVWLSPQVLRLRPAPHCRTPILSYSLTVKPADYFINWQQDPYSNRLARLVFPTKTTEFSVEVDLVAELTVINPFDFFLEKYAEEFPFAYDGVLARELTPYPETTPPDAWQISTPRSRPKRRTPPRARARHGRRDRPCHRPAGARSWTQDANYEGIRGIAYRVKSG